MTSDPEPSGAISLRKRVYLLMAVGIFFPLVVMGVASLTWLRALDERLLAGRLAAATTVAAHFDSELTDDLEVLQRFAASVAPGLGDGEGGGDADAVRRALREAHDRLHHRESVFLLGARGETVAEEPPGPTASAPLGVPLVEEVLANGRPRLSGLVAGARGQVVHELVPIRNWKGQVVGVAGGTFRPEKRDFERMLRNLRPGGTGFAELVDGTGHVLASTDRDRVGHVTECAHQMTQLAAEKRSMTTLCAECHARYGVEKRPSEHLTFASLASAPWSVVVRQDAAEALPTAGALPWYTVLGLLALEVLIAGAFAWGAARSVTAPVAVLTDHAERIAEGDLDWPIPLLGSDEVGRLGQSLEKMRQNLGQLIDHVAQVNAQLEQRVARRTKELNEANEALKEREEARSQLLRKVITAQEDERKRISRELHDETSQDLAVLAMGLEAAQDALRAGKTPRLDEVKAVAVRAIEDVHRLILDLRPSVLDDLGLVSAIRWYAERHLSSRAISVRCEFGDMPRLPPETETALFRISQETLSNVARHAQATAVLVEVGIEGAEVRIAIEDDGRGFDPGAAVPGDGRPHWGLMGIRERAEIFGGTAVIESSPGKGTRVEVRIPVPPRASPSPPPTTQQTSPSSSETQ
jgi:signal transduction histidine kinase